MKASIPYDCSEKNNIKAFKSLPPSMQFHIRTLQNAIQSEIDKKNPGIFRPTSGFRSESVNRKYGGALESLHRLGCARDFVPVAGFSVNSNCPDVDLERFKVIRSPRCWHVEIVI